MNVYVQMKQIEKVVGGVEVGWLGRGYFGFCALF
jgi:hypothetical protein